MITKNQKINELTSLAGESNSLKARLESATREIEMLRQRQKDDLLRHKEEMEVLRKDNLRVPMLESELKSLTKKMEKGDAQHNQNLEKVNKKHEKEKETIVQLQKKIVKLEQAGEDKNRLQQQITLLQSDVEKYQKEVRHAQTKTAEVEA